MAKIKIEEYILVADAFGPIPVWSLQHPIKGYKDAFLIQALYKSKKKWPGWMRELWEVDKFTNKLSRDLIDVEAYIDATVTYEECKRKSNRVIADLKIKYIDIRGFYPTQEQLCPKKNS